MTEKRKLLRINQMPRTEHIPRTPMLPANPDDARAVWEAHEAAAPNLRSAPSPAHSTERTIHAGFAIYRTSLAERSLARG